MSPVVRNTSFSYFRGTESFSTWALRSNLSIRRIGDFLKKNFSLFNTNFKESLPTYFENRTISQKVTSFWWIFEILWKCKIVLSRVSIFSWPVRDCQILSSLKGCAWYRDLCLISHVLLNFFCIYSTWQQHVIIWAEATCLASSLYLHL